MIGRAARLVLALSLGLALGLIASPAGAHDDRSAAGPERSAAGPDVPPALRDVRVDQRIGAAVPLDLVFRDETGATVTLGQLVAGRPAIVSLNQYGCQNLCPLILESLARTLREAHRDLGDGFTVLTVSIDPRETPAEASWRKRGVVGGYLPPAQAARWHFLTGDRAAIARLAAAVGFHFAYDRESNQFAHPTALVVLTPGATVARYLFGMDYPARDLRLALVEASEGKLGSIVDHALLACYRYDAVTGRYSPLIVRIVQAGGGLTVLALGAGLALLFRGERRRAARGREARR